VIGLGAGTDCARSPPAALRRHRDARAAALLRTDTDGDVQVVATGSGLGTIIRGTGGRTAVG
jgi:hypothetical protein